MKPPYNYILLLFCRRRLFELLLFLVVMIILLLFSNTCTLWNFAMLYVILIVSLCLHFIIICYLLPFTIFLLLYQAGKSIILDCLLNQRFVFLLTARTNYENFNIRFKGAVLWNNIEASSKFFALTNLSVSLKSLLLCHIDSYLYFLFTPIHL